MNHVSTEDLELFVLGHLDADKLQTVEEHILRCDSCVIELEVMERSIKALREVYSRFTVEQKGEELTRQLGRVEGLILRARSAGK